MKDFQFKTEQIDNEGGFSIDSKKYIGRRRLNID